ncbi:MAG: hypothetical protein R3C26_08470 [Calditrichia bacterium]
MALTASAPGFIELQLPGSDVPLRILLTPYANAIRFKQALRGESADLSINELLKNSWANTAEKYCDSNGVNLLLAHLFMMREGGEKPEEPDDEKSVLHIGGADVVFAENVPPQIHNMWRSDICIAAKPLPIALPDGLRQQPAGLQHERSQSAKICGADRRGAGKTGGDPRYSPNRRTQIIAPFI